MNNSYKLIQSSHFINLLLFISTLLTLCTFIWLGIHEVNSIKEIRHIVITDVKAIEEYPVEKNSNQINNQLVDKEIQTHLINHIRNSHIVLFGILITVIVMGLIWFFTFSYFRKLKNIKFNEHLLDELLYYNQLNVTHTSSAIQLPTPLKALQLNRDKFLHELKQGLAHNQFILYYQPIINIDTGKIADVEALIRWQHPIHGLLTPDVFLPLCENSGFILPLGEWVLKNACQQIKKWHELGFLRLTMSINLSTRQLNDSQLFSLIKDILSDYQLAPSCLKLEITENFLLKDINVSMGILKSLSQLGLQLSLDDFGTGYSSLNYLKQFPINHLKIDKSFINDMTSNITSMGIVESVINLGKSLGLTLTAEGVENQNQLYMLKKLRCNLAQGYLYSKPVKAEELTQLLHDSAYYDNYLYDSSASKSNLRYDVLSNKHYEQAVDIISQTFCAYEPMTQYLGITPTEFIPFAKLMVDKAIKDGLSIVALDNDTVSACTIVEDMASPLNITIDLDPRFKIIFSFLESLASDFFKERILTKGHIAHLFITAVDKKYHGHGLSKKINFESIQLAKKNEFQFMCCEFTHDYNEKGTVKNVTNSKLLIRTCVYKDFLFEEKKPFENLSGSASAYIWELQAGAKLQFDSQAI